MQYRDFESYADKGTMVPVYRELSADTLTPVIAFLRLRRDDSASFLFESVEGGERIGRYSFLGGDPFLTLSAVGETTTLRRADGQEDSLPGDFFEILQDTIDTCVTVPVPGLPPLTGGAVGYLSYDTIRYIEEIPDTHARETELPDAQLHFHDTLVAFDHAKHRIFLIANAHVKPGQSGQERDAAWQDAQRRLDELEGSLSRPVPGEDIFHPLGELPESSIAEGMESNCTKESFEAAVHKAREHIFAGDIFQVVLSQRFQKPVGVDPFEIYRCLRALNPSPYLFYLEWNDTALLGSSPEIMVRCEEGRALVRPIAGTRRRGKDEAEDLALEEELLADEKELAEHRMLVDLGRNDVGRVAEFGSVRVSKLEEVERYSHVMHIVSEVEGEVREGLRPVDAFRAGFPAGTVSGAPKIRAMEIIDELEPTRRGTYAGAVGYLDFAGNLDTCIAIRTLQIHKGVATVQAGAGIVADSVAENEYFETIHKASALYDAIRRAELRSAGTQGEEPA
ncbi:MAG: anthranilate synthase component I [Planctomycetota bacterium]|nr:anthranilate synthase component I [Planctomycetota bacterium]